MDVCKKKKKSVNESMNEYISESEMEGLTKPSWDSRHPGAMPAKSAPGKLHHNLYKHFPFLLQARSAL